MKRARTKAGVRAWARHNKRWFYIDAELRYHAVVLHLKLSGASGAELDIAGARSAVESLFPAAAYSDAAAEDKFRADLLRYKGQAGFDNFGSNSARLAKCRTRHLGKSKNDIETALDHYETHTGAPQALALLGPSSHESSVPGGSIAVPKGGAVANASGVREGSRL